MKITVIGAGYVGLVTGAVFSEKSHRVLLMDNNEEKVAELTAGKVPISEPGLDVLVKKHLKGGSLQVTSDIRKATQFGEIIFICVSTPTSRDGRADLTAIENVARNIGQNLKRYTLIVEKSTVPAMTGDKVRQVLQRYCKNGNKFDVASNPEFLREGNAVYDALNPDRIVLGVESKRAEQILRKLYKDFSAPIHVVDIKSAELIKHASNSFLAMKISYSNAVAAICEKLGADVEQVIKGVGLDKRIGPGFLKAGIGWGGSCFPKDIAAFYTLAKDVGYNFRLLREVEEINEECRARFIKILLEELWILKGKTIACLGLAFKQDTDDVRSSVAIAIIEDLLKQGALVRAYDPAAEENARKVLGDSVVYCDSAEEAAKGADALAILTEWPQFVKLNFKKIRKILAHPLIVDGRNLLSSQNVRALGFKYRAMGRP